MNKAWLLLPLLFLTIFSGVCFAEVSESQSFTVTPTNTQAQSKVILVPDDYPSISQAFIRAVAGDVIYVRNGVYNDTPLEINRAITIIGEDVKNTIVTLNSTEETHNDPILGGIYTTTAPAIKINANNVKISGLTIISAGGISGNGDNIKIVSNIITTKTSGAITGSNLTISRNTLKGDFIKLTGSNLTLTENILNFSNNGIECRGNYCNIYGNNIAGTLYFMRGSYNQIINNIYDSLFIFGGDSNIITNNSGELSLGNSKVACLNNVVSGNIMQGPSPWGIWIGAHCRNNIFHDNYIVDQGYSPFGSQYCGGIDLCDENGRIGTNNSFYHNVFVNNSVNIYFYNKVVAGGNFWNNSSQGNYWSDYTGIDANKDGVSDIPYTINSLNKDNYPIMTPVAIPLITVPLPTYDSPLNLNEINPAPTTTNNPVAAPTSSEYLIILVSIMLIAITIPAILVFRKISSNRVQV
jgi:nitrous oxidase accessory protein